MTDPTASRPSPLEQAPASSSARASWSGELVARSDRPVVLQQDGQVLGLGFPLDDVRWDLLQDTGRDAQTPTGPARLFSLAGTAPRPGARSWSPDGVDSAVDGQAAVRRHDALGLAVLDHERVLVELVEGEGRDEAAVRFPAWGDAADLVGILDVRREDDGSWTGTPGGRNETRPVAEGSQMLGQSLVAAVRQSGGRRPVSAHMTFLRVADARLPLRFELDELAGGRTFSGYAVRVLQEGKVRAAGTLLLDATAPDVVPFQEPAPPCAGPYDSPAYDMSVLRRDVRVVDGAYTDDPAAPVGPPVVDAWVRFREVPEDPALHIGLLAQFTGHMSIAAALRPHEGVGQAQAHVTLSTGVNAIHLALHDDVRMDRWVRYHHHVTSVRGGMSHAQNAAYDEDGRLLMSFTAECMVRGFAGRHGDARTAL